MDEHKFSVGQLVVTTNDSIGTVKRITPTGRVVVRFESGYEETYRKDGSAFSNDIWSYERIVPLTDERLRQIYEKETVKKCRKMFEETKLTYDQAVRILEILCPNGDDNVQSGEN